MKEETELERPSAYKTKSLRKEGEIWTTSEKEKEKAKTEEIKKHSVGVQLAAAQKEEKRNEKDEEENGQLLLAKRRQAKQLKDKRFGK